MSLPRKADDPLSVLYLTTDSASMGVTNGDWHHIDDHLLCASEGNDRVAAVFRKCSTVSWIVSGGSMLLISIRSTAGQATSLRSSRILDLSPLMLRTSK
jgi:hypothetical protein